MAIDIGEMAVVVAKYKLETSEILDNIGNGWKKLKYNYKKEVKTDVYCE